MKQERKEKKKITHMKSKHKTTGKPGRKRNKWRRQGDKKVQEELTHP